MKDKKTPVISKSDYMLFLRHPAWLWLKKYQKDKLPPIDKNLQEIFNAGHEFEKYVEKLFLDSVKFSFNSYQEYLNLPRETNIALENGTKTVFQGRFETNGLTCIVDVLDRTENNSFNLIEIKSSTRVKKAHYYDLAFQKLVLEKAGLQVEEISVIHVNNEYVRSGKIEPRNLANQVKVTQKVRELTDFTKSQIKKARDVLKRRSMPNLSPRYANHCQIKSDWFHDWLDLYKHLKADLDPYSIYFLSYPNPEQIEELENQGIERICEIPKEKALREKQAGQIKTTKTDQPIIDKEKIANFLETFEYPLYFLDYETFSWPIPNFAGLKPWKDYPFQYSLHIQKSPQSKVEHREYLHQENSNPMPRLLEKLQEDIGEKGTILTWNMSYEKGCNNRMAKLYPEYENFLQNVNERIKDLMTPFSEMWYVDKDFYGSASLKYVLPALVPELTYDDMSVSDGLTARRLWTNTVLKNKNGDTAEEIMENLSKYCTQDTMAMVKILEVLKEYVEETNK